jgi:hypothetical protein
VECAEVEKEGVVLEKRLRERGEGEQGEFMSDWYRSDSSYQLAYFMWKESFPD